MTPIDTALVRDAINIASHGTDRVSLGRLNATYKVLTPSREVVRLTPELLTSMGFVLAEREMRVVCEGEPAIAVGAPQVLVPDDGKPRLPCDFEAALRRAYDFAVTVTPNPPQEGWADFSRFASAMHALVPNLPEGKALRARLGAHDSSWRVRTHTRSDAPGVGGVFAWKLPSIYYVVPRKPKPNTSCRVSMLTANGGKREGAVTSDPARAYDVIRNIPTFVLEEGTRIEVSHVASGTNEVFVFARDGGWRAEDGGPLPRLPWTQQWDDED